MALSVKALEHAFGLGGLLVNEERWVVI